MKTTSDVFPLLGFLSELLIIDIPGVEVQDFTHSHASPGHEFQQVSRARGKLR
jgi:hypothetical protein